MMNSKELSEMCSSSDRSIRRLTKKAIQNKKSFITIKENKYSFIVTSGKYGKSYEYKKLESKTRATKISSLVVKDMGDLSHINLLERVCLDDKLLIINFYKSHSYTLKSIIKNLCFEAKIYPDDKMIKTLMRKVNRWIKEFKDGGKKALVDTRGRGSSFRKIDEDVLMYAIVHSKALANHEGYYRIWDFYCWKMASRDGLDTASRESVISYSAMVSGIKKMIEKHHELFVWVKKGHDGLLQDHPVGVRDIAYTNQEWQVDATKFDFMCVMGDGSIKRVNFSIVIDSFSGGVVGELTDTINSYDQVKVLYKAITKMGLPEVLLSDNGMDYKSNHYQNVLLNNGISQVFAPVGQGRAKGKVERFFRSFQDYISLVPGYVGSNVNYRVNIENQNASKIDVRTSKATRMDISRLLAFDDLNKLCNSILQDKYSAEYKHYEEFRLSDKKLKEIKSSLGKSHFRTLQGDGVMINNITYQSSEIWMMGLNKGDKIEVRENIYNVNEVMIYKDNKFIAIGINRELGAECMDLIEHKKAVKAQKDNHLKPFMEIVKDKDDLYKYQDEFIKTNSGEAIVYEDKSAEKLVSISPSNANKVPKKVVNELDELMKIAGY